MLEKVVKTRKETEMSDFVYLTEKEIYSGPVSTFNYLQQKEAHDLCIVFPGVSCVHQHAVGEFDPSCTSCRLRCVVMNLLNFDNY